MHVGDRKIFNVRTKGSGGTSWYSPYRDICNLFPGIVRVTLEELDMETENDEWLKEHSIDSKLMEEAVKSLCYFTANSLAERDFDACKSGSGMQNPDLKAPIDLLMSRLGWTLLRVWHDYIAEINKESQYEILKGFSNQDG
jgi:hypothetical protein